MTKGCNSHTDTAGSLPTAYRHDIVESRNLLSGLHLKRWIPNLEISRWPSRYGMPTATRALFA